MTQVSQQVASRTTPSAAQIGEMLVRDSLTPLVVLDLIAHGEVPLVARSLAAITDIDQRTIEALLLDRGWIGVRTIFRAAGFEMRHLRAVVVALDLYHEVGDSVAISARRMHAERCLSRFLTKCEHMSAEDLEEVMSLFNDLKSSERNASEKGLG